MYNRVGHMGLHNVLVTFKTGDFISLCLFLWGRGERGGKGGGRRRGVKERGGFFYCSSSLLKELVYNTSDFVFLLTAILNSL